MHMQTADFNQTHSLFNRYFSLGQFEQIIQEAHPLLEQALASNQLQKIKLCYVALVKAYYYLGEIEKTYEQALLYKQHLERLKLSHDDFYVHYMAAHIYEYENKTDSMQQAIDRCLNIASENAAYDELCRAKIFLSNVYLKNGQVELALAEAQQAKLIALAYQVDSAQLDFRIQLLIACALDHMQPNEALFTKLTEHPLVQQNPFEYVQFFYKRATNEIQRQNWHRALDYLQVADTMAVQQNAYLTQLRIVQHYMMIYENLQLYKEALDTTKRLMQLKEIFYQTALSSRLLELSMKHNIVQIQQRANIDPLSGVYNRYYLEGEANNWLEEASLQGDHICCIVFDADNFKQINDKHGHLAGDEVIKMLGQTCLNILSNTETIVARYGGDEFVVMSKSYGAQDVREKSQRLFEAIRSASVLYGDIQLNISISMGVVCNQIIQTTKFLDLFHSADQALYSAKNRGKNQIVFVAQELRNKTSSQNLYQK